MKSILLRNYCGCLVTSTSKHSLIELEQIEYCPKHAAAPELLVVLTSIIETLEVYEAYEILGDDHQKAVAIIARAAPPDDISVP